jgi:hypothetical protein
MKNKLRMKGYNKSAVLNTRKYKRYKNETVQQRIQGAGPGVVR